MGQSNEKLAHLDDKFKDVESVREDLKKKAKETEMKIEILHEMQTGYTTNDHHVNELERALEEALVEREQILEACEKEIEHEKNIAIELEQKMMEDFEWKLREVERGYTAKVKSLEESLKSKREIYKQEISEKQESYVKDLAKWKSLENVLNLKLNEKKQECDDNITYYSQREAEYDTKVDELMTRLQDQTAAYMKLQSEFDNYEWWDEEEDGGAHGHSHSEDKKRSRESLANRSRPPTRPPTREDIVRPPITNIQELQAGEEEEEEDEYEYEEAEDDSKNVQGVVFEPPPKEFATLPRALSPSNSLKEEPNKDPEIPPRRGERAGNPEDAHPTWQDDAQSTKRSSTSSGKSTKKGNCTQQ